ncbi:MAG: ribbon-helix-helix domain-containing protein [Salinarimonas sp.]
MSKRASLFGARGPKLVEDDDSAAATAEASAPSAIAPSAAPVPAAGPEPKRKYPVAKTREGKRVATVYLEPEALRQLKRIGFDEETTVQELLVEGINAVFEKRGLSRIA